jgi:hypothetical protein
MSASDCRESVFYTAIFNIICSLLNGRLIEVEGAKTPAGAAGQVRPRRRFSAEGGSPPAPKVREAPGTEINRPVEQPVY